MIVQFTGTREALQQLEDLCWYKEGGEEEDITDLMFDENDNILPDYLEMFAELKIAVRLIDNGDKSCGHSSAFAFDC